MPSGDNPRSRANLKRFGIEREARSAGVKGGKASGKARAEYKDMRDSLRERLTPEESDKIMDVLIKRIEAGNLKALEIALKMMGSDESRARDRLQEAQIAKLKRESEDQTGSSEIRVIIQSEDNDYSQ